MPTHAVETFELTKRFDYREPSGRGSTSGMWVQYLLGRLGRRGGDPFAPKKSELVAVDRVDLTIRQGEFFGLLGPNGAGKTTLVKMLATILLPSDGTARVNGYDVRRETGEVRRSIAVVSSGGWLGFDMQLSLAWNLQYWAALYGIPERSVEQKVKEVLRIVDLEHKAEESSAVLSSGMRQRLAIAKGLLADAPLFLLDEPTVALDPKSANDIRSFVKEEVNHRKGTTVLLTTQNMYEAEELCDRVGILEGGRLIACGSPAELKRQMAGTVVRLAASGLSTDVVRAFRDRFHLEHSKYRLAAEKGSGWFRFHLDNGHRPFGEMREYLAREGVDIADLQVVEPNLEDIYLNLTGKGL